ncbi:hypothetical protein AALP_AA3G140700 [Arabis alpina]|uniref:DUF659 domain-containing protein n=1 Tax=Arabis alpina TaxID=50452 RepID=A0A087H937_ARAAL|nr:hypothetical protein AALP_AA3G140700 [Arabis alpina]
MMTESGCQKIPDSHDLDGWMLQEALKEVQDHVKKVKDSWAVTGCSLLLDAWVDQKGRDLVSFIADCPAGPVYLISFDVTDIKNDVHALTSLVDELVEEVGVHNVIQIIASSSSGWVGELGKSFAANNNKVFWSGKDCFNEASQADQISNISPGASRYKLKRRLAEKLLLNEGRSRGEEQHLEELAFVHYNLHLQSCKAKKRETRIREMVDQLFTEPKQTTQVNLEMADTFLDIHEHGTRVENTKYRVKCNYCGKEMGGWFRLKRHLGGVRGDVAPCEQVTDIVREAFRKMVTEESCGVTVNNKVGEVQMGTGHKRGRSEDSSSKSVFPESENIGMETDKADLFDNKGEKCIGRFFYENSIDFSVVDSPSFKEMMTVSAGQSRLKIPDSHELKGWMFQEVLKEVQDHVKKIQDSWAVTGCSILLDAWIDSKGRDLVAFVADCPAGPVYLKSVDVSDIKSNSNALISLLDELVDEVGMHNVVQIIGCSTSGWVGELGKSLAGNKKEFFWSVSVSHCFELMLLKVAKTNSLGDIVDNANKITEFVNNNPLALKLVGAHSHGMDMTVSSSDFEFLMPYLTLKSIFKAKNDLAGMFASSEWNKEEDITISELVNDSSFWETVEGVVKCTSPLIRGLLLFSANNGQHLGYIYDIMDDIKESIASEFNDDKLCYKPLWDVIDDVWNKHLHIPLHAAGYFLNPASFYSTAFHLDPEVATGLTSSVVHIVKERHIQLQVVSQLDLYRLGEDFFDEASQADQISEISPVEWWSQKASEYPELQSFAIKILSQTCEGASRYKLKRSLAEKLLLTEGMSHREKQHLEELAFVHYNLHLQRYKAKLSESSAKLREEH